MRTLIVLVLAALVVWVAVNYFRTGTLSLLPSATGPSDQELRELREELAAVNAKIEAAGRAAGLSGVDTTTDVGALQTRKQQIETRIEQLSRAH